MAFVAEDGTGLANANSYDSVANLDAYWADRNVTLVGTTQVKEAALIVATDYIDLVFGSRFIGFKATSTQSLAWPRIYARDENCVYITGVPIKLKYALYEYVSLILSGIDLMPVPIIDDSGMLLTASFEKVGPIEERKTFQATFPRTIRPYPKADSYLSSLISGACGGSIRA